jgi:dGTPase
VRRAPQLATVSTLAEIDDLLATLDLDAPYPVRRPRASAGVPARPNGRPARRWLERARWPATTRGRSPTPRSTPVAGEGGALGALSGRPSGYDDHDAERFLAETHRSQRDSFARDRARVLHSAALRRLAAKTQVLSPASPADFARNRLTHSLEVAQVGRELAIALELSPDVVDTACASATTSGIRRSATTASALNEWAEDIGGFEGAQTLRILSRLEPKVLDAEGRSVGLNLTRASLDATCKYPWTVEHAFPDPGGRDKFGVYPEDEDVFRWMRRRAGSRPLHRGGGHGPLR